MAHVRQTLIAATLVAAALSPLGSTTPAQAAGTISTTLRGYAQVRFHPGDTFRLTAVGLPQGRVALCAGLSSRSDPSGLPMNLGRVTQRVLGTGPVYGIASVSIPQGLLRSEPAGAWMLFVGPCAGQTVDVPAVSVTTICIE